MESISKYGLVSEVFLPAKDANESADRFCTCVFRSEKTEPIQSYCERYSTYEYKDEDKRKEYHRGKATQFKNVVYQAGEESVFLPGFFRGGNANRVGFIIEPRIANVFHRIKFDKNVKGVANNPYERAYGVQFAIPPSYICGLLVPQNFGEEEIELLKSLFKDQYIVSTNGDLLYTPERAEVKDISLEVEKKGKNPLYWTRKTQYEDMRIGISDIESVDREIQKKIREAKEYDEKNEISDVGGKR